MGNKFALGNKPNKISFKKGIKPWNKDIKYCDIEGFEHKCGKHLNSRNGFKIGHKGWNDVEREERNCLECKEIYVVKINSGRKYCSRKCSGIDRRTTIEHICPECKVKFIGRKERKFCSNSCKSKAQDRIQIANTLRNKYKTGELEIWNKKPRVERKCFYCNKIMMVIETSKKKFCNEKCMGLNSVGRILTKEHIRNSLRRREISSLEKKFNDIVFENNLPYKFVGNGNFFIERKNPDFINTNGEKIAVEVYAKYYKLRNNISIDEWKENRQKIFNEYGWKIIFFDETEVNEENVIRKLNHGGG